ncbi:type II secretion system F family protein [Comamonas composti]|uniref:type II secretion system F family protein n=1 Tax=Comamonas composti TaxID=408558 RepID=UPI00041BF9F1|nr:type II secretion system F family protein [Comamonas composti]
MSAQLLWIISLTLGALGLALGAASLIWRLLRSARAQAQVGKLLQDREAHAPVSSPASPAPLMAEGSPFTMPGSTQQLLNPQATPGSGSSQDLAASLQPPAWLESGLAKALLADEDRKLLDQAGISLRNGSMVYVASRLALGIALPLLALVLLKPAGISLLIYAFFGFGLGLMLPKWIVGSKARRRREQVVEELPLFVDLLRLLQGVGLSVDQSLQILATEFGSVLRVLSGELTLANQLYANGRSREQSFQRLAHLSADEDMSAVVNLLVQVDRHGGAVQEPLREFSVRLREKRQAGFKEKIGAITVKMTGVMVLTLLPALLVITAGPGFMAVIRSLSSMGGR